MKCILLSATYDNQRKKPVLKFYDPELQKIVLWTDNTDHKPYCYTMLQSAPKNVKVENVVVHDILKDHSRPMAKIIASNPAVIGNISNNIVTWESDIKYHQSYLYDNNFIVGTWYDVTKDSVTPVDNTTDTEMQQALGNISNNIDNDKFLEQVENWTILLNQEVPDIKRLAFDIEVETTDGRLPSPSKAEQPITAIGFEASDFHKVFLLKRDSVELGNETDNSVLFDSEHEMIEEALKVIESYPVVLTFNGDAFDMPYLHNRAVALGIKDTPLLMLRKNATLRRGIHIDLYPLFKNKSLRIYAFSNKYSDLSLDTIAESLIGENKLEHGDLNTIPIYDLGKYCYNDARITYNLTSFNSNLVFNLLIMLARIGKMPIDDINRLGMNHWTKSLFQYYQRQTKTLIPNREELDEKTVDVSEKAIIKDKKYKGALVMEPTAGIHFNVKCLDFGSLYPSIIKNYNLSFETTRCNHFECQKNMLDGTKHWTCTKSIGIASLLIGSLMELRLNYYKQKSKTATTEEEKEKYVMITQTLKVILNGSYGVVGFEKFPYYYLPMAESITGIGRFIIENTKKDAEEMGMVPLYGDTDSIFIRNPTDKQVNTLMTNTKDRYGISLEVDKEYRYMVLSNRKKNYFGVLSDNRLDIKGLSGKKSHTPPFLKSLFGAITNELRKINTSEDFTDTKKAIGTMIRDTHDVLIHRNIPLPDLAISMFLAKEPEEYTKTVPQHLKAAKMLPNTIKMGEYIQYVKTSDRAGVKPLQLATVDDINVTKYRELMSTTLKQILDPLDVDFEEAIGMGRATTIDDFFG